MQDSGGQALWVKDFNAPVTTMAAMPGRNAAVFAGMCQIIQTSRDDGTTHRVYVGYR